MKCEHSLLLALILLAGCCVEPVPFEPSACHPANPDVPQAAFIPPTVLKAEEPVPAESSEARMGDAGNMEGMKGMGAHHHVQGQAAGNGEEGE